MVFCITTGRYWACGHWIWSKTFKRIIYCPWAFLVLFSYFSGHHNYFSKQKVIGAAVAIIAVSYLSNQNLTTLMEFWICNGGE